jgi:hypothetical protein
MALGALGPWADAERVSSGALSTHGSGPVLVAAVSVVLMRGRGALLMSVLSAVGIAIGMYTLPGDLVQAGAAEAEVAWGAYVALAGAVLVAAASLWVPGSAQGSRTWRGVCLVCVTVAFGLVSAGWAGVGASGSHGAWVHHARDNFSVTSADGSARAVAAIEWHHGAFPAGLLHRGVFTRDSAVEAIRPVGCLWVRLEWGFPLGTVASFGAGYRVKCRAAGDRSSPRISLAGQGYAKTLLNTAMLTMCVSGRKVEGPRSCGTQKVTYSPF